MIGYEQEVSIADSRRRRGRFAPTPSGVMHLGNLFAALLAWLQMRSCGGQFVLRIEDIDKPRSRPEYIDQILIDLRWLGLDWDEGPDAGGPYAPYEQSAREELYLEALERLQREGWLYPCFCSRAELQTLASAPHGLASEGHAYPGLCRHLTQEQREIKRRTKRPALRFTMPEQPLVFIDAIQGTQQAGPGAGGDFVVQRADGLFGYQLAVVVDDAAMQITDVLRGADLLDSTPRQLRLFQALGWPAPRYAHVPLLYGPDGQRLSKRHGSLAVQHLRSCGTSAERIVGRLAYWAGLLDRPEPLTAQELIPLFDPRKLPTEPLRLDSTELQALQG